MNAPARRPAAIAQLIAIAALVTIGCSGGDASARSTTVQYDTIGDTIVAHAQQAPLWGDSVSLVEEVRVGELEGPEEYTFGRVVSMTVDSAGAMYVLDQQALTVRVYDESGRHVRDIGRSGAGPGELTRPHGLDFMPDGRLAVRDFGNARINFYDPSGESAGTLTIPGGFSTTTPMHVDTLGRIFTSVVADRPEGEIFRVGYQRFEADGTIGDTIRTPRPDVTTEPLTASSPDGSSMSAMSVPFSPGLQWTIDRGGNVVWAVTNDYTIHTIQNDRPFRITRMTEAVPVQAAEKAAAEEGVVSSMRQTQSNWSWDGPAIPDVKPFIGAVTIAHDGRIWVKVRQ
ncbi:MAG TPA: 6-bladed beta-propeller, partial [Longimicrobiales bacterium]|nr:6-bladed beta-propeller [Longimicrobiales bacterium]